MSEIASEDLLRALLTRLSVKAFDRFLLAFYKEASSERFFPLSEIGEHVFAHPVPESIDESLHRVYVVHHSPLAFAARFTPSLVFDPDLLARVSSVGNVYAGQTGTWRAIEPFPEMSNRKLQSFAILTNISGFDREVYSNEIIPAYRHVVTKLNLPQGSFFVGSPDSFLATEPAATARVFGRLINDADELCITLINDRSSVRRATAERYLESGILAATAKPLEPVYIFRRDEAALQEFEQMLDDNVPERKLEAFLAAHYNLLFGAQYDRVETQLWLRFPDLDINHRARRLDVFLRNAVTRDWELKELKRAKTPLLGDKRDIPVLASAVTRALQQLRNYARMLRQDEVRRRLAAEGLEYYEPVLSLVVGRAPDISHQQWRWLVQSTADIRITTYDELLGEARTRAVDRARAAREQV